MINLLVKVAMNPMTKTLQQKNLIPISMVNLIISSMDGKATAATVQYASRRTEKNPYIPKTTRRPDVARAVDHSHSAPLAVLYLTTNKNAKIPPSP